MHTWVGIATSVSVLLTLATAAINLATAIRTHPRHDRNRHQDDSGDSGGRSGGAVGGAA